MKLKYLSTGLLLLLAVACGKNEKAKPENGGGGNNTSQQPLHIEKALFTSPSMVHSKTSDPSVMRQLIIYLNHTPKGAVVHINVYQFNYAPVLEAVKSAYQRGVVMKVLIDNEHGKNTTNAGTIADLENTLKSPSVITPVNNDARPSETAIDHNKYVLFSEVDMPDGVAENVVFAASHNFTLGQTEKLQDAVIMSNKALYDVFLSNWNEIASLADQGMKNFKYSVNNIGDSITAFFFPRLVNGVWDGKSTIIEQLDKLSDYDKDTVCVLMSEMHASIGLKIAQKLTELEKKGVNVQVITRLEPPQVSADVKSELEDNLEKSGGYVKLIDNSKEGTVHSKTMLIKGVFEGKMQRIILTGSLNYHTNATGSNDNFVLLLKNSALFNDYWNNFELVKKLF